MPATSTTADLQIVHVPINDLRPDPANPRKMSDAPASKIVRLMSAAFLPPLAMR